MKVKKVFRKLLHVAVTPFNNSPFITNCFAISELPNYNIKNVDTYKSNLNSFPLLASKDSEKHGITKENEEKSIISDKCNKFESDDDDDKNKKDKNEDEDEDGTEGLIYMSYWGIWYICLLSHKNAENKRRRQRNYHYKHKSVPRIDEESF